MKNGSKKMALILTMILSIALPVPVFSIDNASQFKMPLDAAEYFVKHVYSDFRNENDNENFESNVNKFCMLESKNFIKLLQDRKYLREQIDKSFRTKNKLKLEVHNGSKIIESDGKKCVARLEVEYLYDEILLADSKSEEAVDSGIVVTYIVHLIYDDGWKIYGIKSDDLTAGIMFPEILGETNPSSPAVEEPEMSITKKSKSKVKFDIVKNNTQYDIDKLVKEQSKIGIDDVKERTSDVLNDDKDSLKKKNIILKSKSLKPKSRYKKFTAAPLRAYQNKWWKKPNPKYVYHKDRDCANYVSQVWYAGGAPKRKSGAFKWYPEIYGWVNVGGLRNFVLNNTIRGPAGHKTNKVSDLTCGDLMVFGKDRHAMIIYKGGSSNPVITAHTKHYMGRANKRYNIPKLKKVMVTGYYY